MIWLFLILLILMFFPPFKFIVQDFLGGLFNLIAFLFNIGIGYIIFAVLILMAYRS